MPFISAPIAGGGRQASRGTVKLVALAVATCTLMASQAASGQQEQSMKIRMVINGAPVSATLHDNPAAREFHKLLPLDLKLDDYASAEKIASLPRKLDTAGVPPGFAPSAGDIAYYAPWGNLALFYRSQPYATGLVSLGHIDAGADALKTAGKLHVRIEPVK